MNGELLAIGFHGKGYYSEVMDRWEGESIFDLLDRAKVVLKMRMQQCKIRSKISVIVLVQDDYVLASGPGERTKP
jgi:hypothetical protein